MGRRFRTHHGATVLTSLTSALEMDEQPDRGFSVVGLGVGPDAPALPARLDAETKHDRINGQVYR